MSTVPPTGTKGVAAHEDRMSIMREVVEWLRLSPKISYMAHSATNGVGLAPSWRAMTVYEAADELERQIEAGTA